MSFEEESIDAAIKALEETEKKCQVGDGFVKSVRKRFSKKKRKEVCIRVTHASLFTILGHDKVLFFSTIKY